MLLLIFEIKCLCEPGLSVWFFVWEFLGTLLALPSSVVPGVQCSTWLLCGVGNQTQDFMVSQQTLYLPSYSIALVGQGPDPQSGTFQVLNQIPAHPTTDHPIGCLSLTSFLPKCPNPTPCFLANGQPVWYLETAVIGGSKSGVGAGG